MTDQSRLPVNELADRFWEGILELNPTTATFYGDPATPTVSRIRRPRAGLGRASAHGAHRLGGRGHPDRCAID